MRVVYGLGNPEERHAFQRHNAGRLLVERFAAGRNVRFDQNEEGVAFGRSTRDEEDLILAYPTTLMNRSGTGFRSLRQSFAFSLTDVLIVYDDIDLPAGTLRVRASGGDGGHRGLRSVLESAGTKEVPRMRIGIGSPPDGQEAADYVLEEFPDDQWTDVRRCIRRGCKAVQTWLREDLETVMNEYNESE